MTQNIALVADVGGTNTRMALSRDAGVDEASIRRFRNAAHPRFEDVLRMYLQDLSPGDLTGICVAVAGTVKGGIAKVTNHDWTIGEPDLHQITHAPVACVMNDLQALGHSVGHIPRAKLRTVLPGRPQPEGAPRLVVGVGTGFNIAPVHDYPGGRVVPASEAGYACLPVRNEHHLKLAQFVAPADGHPAIEEVLSGRGVGNVYGFEHPDGERLDAAEVMAMAGDGDPIAKRALATFLDVFGGVVGDLALEHMPLGGIYLAGGVSRSVAPHFETSRFAVSFREKGKLSAILDDIPVLLIEDDYAPLLGAAAHLGRQFAQATP